MRISIPQQSTCVSTVRRGRFKLPTWMGFFSDNHSHKMSVEIIPKKTEGKRESWTGGQSEQVINHLFSKHSLGLCFPLCLVLTWTTGDSQSLTSTSRRTRICCISWICWQTATSVVDTGCLCMCLGEWEVELQACFELLSELYARKERSRQGNGLEGGNRKSKWRSALSRERAPPLYRGWSDKPSPNTARSATANISYLPTLAVSLVGRTTNATSPHPDRF